MATPFVAGEAALVRADDGPLDAAGVERRIRSSSRCLEDLPLRTLGAGHADIGAALEQDTSRSCDI